MRNTSFIQLFYALSINEAKLFYQFTQGMYSKQQVPLRLLAYFVQERTKGTIYQQLDINEAYQYTFQQVLETRNDRKKLLNIMADIHKWLKKYLIFQEVEEDAFVQNFLFLRAIHRRKLITTFQKAVNKIKTILEKEQYDFWQPLKLLFFHHAIFFNSVSIPPKEILPSLAILPKYLTQFYLRAKIKYETALVGSHNILFFPKIKPDLSIIRREIAQQEEEDPYLQLYYWISILCEAQTEEAYLRVKAFFLTSSFYTKEEAIEVLTYLMNYIASHHRTGTIDKVKDQFELFKRGLDTTILLIGGQLSKRHFQNIITTACHLKEFDFVENFMQVYGDKLRVPNAAFIIHLYTARVLIEKKQFEEALKLLSIISFTDFMDDATRRSYQLICLMELKEQPRLLNNRCDNFLLYIKRNKSVKKKIALGYKNFVAVVQKIIRGEPKASILTFLNSASAIVYKKWLLEKLN